MIAAILVDDEKIIRLGLRKMITDHCPQITEIHEAENGEEALALTLRERPDLGIVDMRMPRMNGLEYIARVRQAGLDAKMIILSGYADFAYAQQALAEGCCGYLLKPVKVEELIELLWKTIEEIKQERRLAEQTRGAHRREWESQFRQAVTQGEGRVPGLGERLERRRYYAALLSLDGPGAPLWSGPRMDQPSDRKLEQAGAALTEAALAHGWDACALALDERTLYLLLLPREGQTCAENQLPNWLAGAHEGLSWAGLVGTLGFCGPFEGEGELRHSYLSAMAAVERRFYEGTGRLFLPAPDGVSNIKPALYTEERRFLTAVRAGKIGEAEQALRQIFEALRTNQVKKTVCILVFSHLRLNLLEARPDKPAATAPAGELGVENFEEQLGIIDTFDELCGYIETLFLQGAATAGEARGASRSLVRNAVRYVEQHVDCPVSVNEVADYLGVSVSYFSTLFHRETGEKFISFIIQYKMDKACEMLEQTTRKVYEISEALGYTDVKYFCKIFRKYTGCTPSEYRESGQPEP